MKGGYDVEFIKEYPDDNVTCSICLYVLREPLQSIECGHRFCESCVADLTKCDNGKYVCPEDRNEMSLFPDKGKEREILGRTVKCPNSNAGCRMTLVLRYLNEHEEKCDFKVVQCVVSACAERFQQQYEDQHYKECEYRIIQCPFCKDDYIMAFEREHIENCEEFLECCDYCDVICIPRSKMEAHLSQDCNKLPHACLFISIGCTEKSTKDKLSKHQSNSTEHHLRLALAKITAQDQINYNLQRDIGTLLSSHKKLLDSQSALQTSHAALKRSHFQLQEKVNNLTNQSGIWEIHGFNNKMKHNKSIYYSLKKHIYTTEGYKLLCTLYPKGTTDDRCRLYVRTEKGAFDDKLIWPMRVDIKCVLIANEATRDREWIIRTHINNMDGSFNKPPHGNDGLETRLITPEDLPEFLSDGTLTLRITSMG